MMQIRKTLASLPGSQHSHYSEASIMETIKRSPFYMLITIAISYTAFWGFTYTYFSPVIAGTYPDVSPTLHIHGWSFFLWYLIVPLQALLMVTGHWRLHITLGSASLVLAAAFFLPGYGPFRKGLRVFFTKY